ncbi:glutamate--tRNA ligase-like [Sycon ciliatum]|uniref:glutamate--tRNA ligase-like n=1 Tax=Sycon ciliatum TaxID=27933 RepID=UPI0031F69244
MLSLLIYHGRRPASIQVIARLCSSNATTPVSDVRVRFAPSPTGDLHLGSLRTVLFNYAFAKKNNGTFILRVEDTDQKRSVPGAVERMMDILKWVKMMPDEGPGVGGDYGPYIQSERTKLYRQFADKLLQAGSAYPCFCSAELLAEKRQQALANRSEVQYDGTCRHHTDAERAERIAHGEPHTIRMKVPEDFSVELDDLVVGKHTFTSQIMGDQVLLKADGFPTYHLANVVDDHLMQISHVIRGKEWVSSTGLHLLLYSVLGWTPPRFLHLPLIVKEDGRKLSKRDADSFVSYYREAGYQPDPILAFISGLEMYGQGCEGKRLTMEELLENFTLDTPSDIRLVHDSLPIFQMNHVRTALDTPSAYREELVDEFRRLMRSALSSSSSSDDVADERWSDEYLVEALKELVIRHGTLKQCAEQGTYYMVSPTLTAENLAHQSFKAFSALTWNSLCESLDSLEDWTADPILAAIKAVSKQHKIKMGRVLPAMRLCLMGIESGVGVAPFAALIGKTATVSRLHRYEKQLQLGS